MNNQLLKTAALMLVLTTVIVVVGQWLINKLLNTMLLAKITKLFDKWEGDLSRDPADTASSNPAPWSHKGLTGWHTKRGVTYTTFVSMAQKCGYDVTPENFFNMSDKIWLDILQKGFMQPYPLSKIAHLPRIQAVIITWAWGSGVGGAERLLAKFQREVMGVVDSNITKDEIVQNFKAKINPLNEKEWFDKLCDRRAADFKSMATYYKHGNGWNARLADFRKLFN